MFIDVSEEYATSTSETGVRTFVSKISVNIYETTRRHLAENANFVAYLVFRFGDAFQVFIAIFTPCM
jgi:hypothetical protein